MKKLVLLICVFCLISTVALAKTYLRQNSFYAPGTMTDTQAQVKAIGDMKAQLIKELFSYAKFTTLWNTIDRSDTLSAQNVETLKPLITLNEIIEESRDDNVYYINAEFQANEDDIMNNFRDIFSDEPVQQKPVVKQDEPQTKTESQKAQEVLVKKDDIHEAPLTGSAYEYFKKAIEAQQLKRYQEALTFYEKSLEKNPNNAEAHNNMGIILSILGAHEAAIQHFNEAKNINPELPQVYNNLGNAYESLGKLHEAVKHYEMAISVQTNYTDSYYNLARVYTDMREFEKAEAVLNKLIQLDASNAYACFGMGNMYAKKRDFDKAITWFEKAIELKPNYGEAHYRLGVTYGLKGDMDKGIQHINYANSLGYEYQDDLVFSSGDTSQNVSSDNFVVIGSDTQVQDDGIKSTIVYKTEEKPPVQETVKIEKPGEIDTITEDPIQQPIDQKDETVNTKELYQKFEKLLGKTDQNVGDAQNLPEEVKPTTIQSEEFTYNPSDDISNQFGFLLKDKFKDEPTMEFANKREAIAELFKEGYTSFMNGEYDKSAEAYTNVLDLDSKNAMAMYSLGTVYAFQKDNDKALDYLLRAIDINKTFPKAWDNAGFVYYQQGNYNKSIEYLLKAVSMDSTMVNALVVLGDAYQQVDNKEKKIEYYKKAARLGDMQAQAFLKKEGFDWD
ncbi:MAG: tetratricopeptide repeat protein [Candidatus Cloacimonetes bacterium]|nr:tetratricopeptide repeat protein [Candidatus Cloacimonadota bacterium]